MQKCENCNSQFGWEKVFKSFWWAYRPIECDNCGNTHKITILGRLTGAAISVVPMMLFFNYLSPFDSSSLTISTGLIIGIVGLLVAPYVIQYKRTY
ncbi:hypothetical protein CWR48_06080 [Oceanobacillus arenosus]|uniref:Cxxc_20_cxxc protein n=1 Tax=Oceanobacillus arenosus TaxID=1229153 RepID=A0A3D8PY61_9BACI|nr:TIGR04104 family putative zinc finger protein [Oceanobacillus arenosus]RDW20261.1 hypothetical protein CWR48_06080 [Oceanobacillus arenosus]